MPMWATSSALSIMLDQEKSSRFTPLNLRCIAITSQTSRSSKMEKNGRSTDTKVFPFSHDRHCQIMEPLPNGSKAIRSCFQNLHVHSQSVVWCEHRHVWLDLMCQGSSRTGSFVRQKGVQMSPSSQA